MRPRNQTAPTARDVADWLLTELSLEGPLGPRETAEELEDLFGPGVFTSTDDDGRLVISREVVALLEGMARQAGVTQLWRDG
jgi:hypothetical protein